MEVEEDKVSKEDMDSINNVIEDLRCCNFTSQSTFKTNRCICFKNKRDCVKCFPGGFFRNRTLSDNIVFLNDNFSQRSLRDDEKEELKMTNNKNRDEK